MRGRQADGGREDVDRAMSCGVLGDDFQRDGPRAEEGDKTAEGLGAGVEAHPRCHVRPGQLIGRIGQGGAGIAEGVGR